MFPAAVAAERRINGITSYPKRGRPQMEMPTILRFAIALDLVLIGIEHAVPFTSGVLPVGGSPLAQFAVLMCFGVAATELQPKR
jgi:hypothetical protein